MALKIYNSITRKKEEFKPLNPPYVGMYVCGPTVYGHPHLGHARSYITFDIIYRYLQYSGYKVRYVQNVTDVGHLVGDMDSGEDKIQQQAKVEKMEPMEIAYKYEMSYFEDMDNLNILRPSISSRATGHIPDMIEHIEKLIKKEYAYVSKDGNVYFDIRKFKDYGKLSGRNLEETKEGIRVEQAKDKNNPEDFALWKKADKAHLMQWNSPWGKGYPGWHIECSVMGIKYIGETLDIHGGGIDNIFPHHECEIAQSEAITGKDFVRCFIHNNLITVNGTKMGKSLGNFIILKDLFKKIDPMVLRFYILQGHYHTPLDFTNESLEAAGNGYERMKNSIMTLKDHIRSKESSKSKNIPEIQKLKDQFLAAMNDDFNTPQAIAIIYEILKISNNELLKKDPSLDKLITINNLINELAVDILGFKFEQTSIDRNKEADLIKLFINMRNNYRKSKDFAMSDEIRDKLLDIGITLKDGPEGTTYSK